jgi:hypothetical protein
MLMLIDAAGEAAGRFLVKDINERTRFIVGVGGGGNNKK